MMSCDYLEMTEIERADYLIEKFESLEREIERLRYRIVELEGGEE